MHRTTSLVLLSALGLVACGEDTGLAAPLAVQGNGYRGVLLPASEWASSGYEVEGFWDATGEDVARAEAALPDAARRHAPEWAVPPERYVRQYVGVVVEGHRVLYVNLLHEDAIRPTPDDDPEDHDRWRRELMVVDDGGDWFVEGFFDADKGEFTRLWVHGEA